MGETSGGVVAQRLTSIRFDEETLEKLALVAQVNGTNIAAEVRRAVSRHLDVEISDDFEERLDARHAQQLADWHRLKDAATRTDS